jgi:hypothetical protein
LFISPSRFSAFSSSAADSPFVSSLPTAHASLIFVWNFLSPLVFPLSADLLEVEQYNGNVVFQGIIDCAKAALEHDIPVVLGNDVGCPWIIQCPKKEKQSKKNSTAFSDLSELSFFFSYLPILSRWLFHFSHHNQIFRHFFLPVL